MGLSPYAMPPQRLGRAGCGRTPARAQDVLRRYNSPARHVMRPRWVRSNGWGPIGGLTGPVRGKRGRARDGGMGVRRGGRAPRGRHRDPGRGHLVLSLRQQREHRPWSAAGSVLPRHADSVDLAASNRRRPDRTADRHRQAARTTRRSSAGRARAQDRPRAHCWSNGTGSSARACARTSCCPTSGGSRRPAR